MPPIAVRVLVAVLILSLAPGLLVAVENACSLVATGHLAHASGPGGDPSPVGPEHGCSGPFHVCFCHHSPAFDLVPLALGPLPERLRLGASDAGARSFLEPFLSGPDRPPRS